MIGMCPGVLTSLLSCPEHGTVAIRETTRTAAANTASRDRDADFVFRRHSSDLSARFIRSILVPCARFEKSSLFTREENFQDNLVCAARNGPLHSQDHLIRPLSLECLDEKSVVPIQAQGALVDEIAGRGEEAPGVLEPPVAENIGPAIPGEDGMSGPLAALLEDRMIIKEDIPAAERLLDRPFTASRVRFSNGALGDPVFEAPVSEHKIEFSHLADIALHAFLPLPELASDT